MRAGIRSDCERDRLYELRSDEGRVTLMTAVQDPISAPMPGSLVVNLKPQK
jgi:hypothetical protein